MSTARRAFPAEVREIERQLEAGVYPGIRVDLPPANRYWFVSEVAGERVGLACLSVDQNDLVGVLCRCWVDPRFRRNGVAGALWEARESLAKELHVALLQVIVNTDDAEEKYRSRGFRVQIALDKGRRLMVRP